MARGGRRAGAGRKQKPIETHLLAGTFRPDRHGPQPVVAGSLALATTSTPKLEQPPAYALEGLGLEGRRFMCAAFQDFECTATEIEVLRVAAQSYDDAAIA